MLEIISERSCTRCFLCIDACPVDVIRAKYEGNGDAKVFIAYPVDCMVCHLCEDVCPVEDPSLPSGKAIYVRPERSYQPVRPY